MILPALYHWSPTTRREDIRREGLRPYAAAVRTAFTPRAPYICFSPTPSRAWGFSGDMADDTDEESWDLWQVRLGDGDEVHVRPFFGNVLEEIRIFTPIPADRCWYVATRPSQRFED